MGGLDLDRAVMMCEGFNGFFYASEDWEDGGPIIEREKISLSFNGKEWEASIAGSFVEKGFSPLYAAMRCYVASKFGDTVEIPEYPL